MKKTFLAVLIACAAIVSLTSCGDNKAAEVNSKAAAKETKKEKAPVKTDGSAIGYIETGTYTMKLHKVFAWQPKAGGEILAGMNPKEGYRFIYLDVSLKNKSAKPLDGGFVFIALKITDEKGTEYKKPAAALASYLTENPEAQNSNEYDALWEKFAPGEFHREIIYAVEVPVDVKNFILSLPVDNTRKEWNKINFSA